MYGNCSKSAMKLTLYRSCGEIFCRVFQRIARDRLDAEHWFDYGTFNLYINDIEKAEECFKVDTGCIATSLN